MIFVACGSLCKICSITEQNGVSCTTCVDTAYRDVRGKTAVCKPCTSSENGPGCKTCFSGTSCSTCISSAYAITTLNKCVTCSGLHAACVECDATSGTNKCTKCKSGYYVKSDKCSECPRNCDTCEETNNAVQCTKCKALYAIVRSKSCDRCPDNCLSCKVSGTNVVCDSCTKKYATNANNICEKCPDNCNKCTWSSANTRLECDGSDVSHSCIENENGKSWGRKSDGTCVGRFLYLYINFFGQFNLPFYVACPNNCEKCYFKSSSASAPICYASRCAKGNTFDDVTGNCVGCPTGCDYCKKRSSGSVCLKCSEKYAPKYSSADVIEFCIPCSVQNCDYCEVIGNSVQCLRSPCASKKSGTNKKFSFTSKQCATDCPNDSECDSGFVNDETEACYCRSCPAGKVIIEAGSDIGVCKGCGDDCENCVLTNDKTNVECKTCAGSKQWITVEVGGSPKKGCYGAFQLKFIL